MASAALLAPSLTAFLASPTAFWASPFNSCAAPSPFSFSEPTTLPMPCFALPTASLAMPEILSVVPLMMGTPVAAHNGALTPQRASQEAVPLKHGFYGSPDVTVLGLRRRSRRQRSQWI